MLHRTSRAAAVKLARQDCMTTTLAEYLMATIGSTPNAFRVRRTPSVLALSLYRSLCSALSNGASRISRWRRCVIQRITSRARRASPTAGPTLVELCWIPASATPATSCRASCASPAPSARPARPTQTIVSGAKCVLLELLRWCLLPLLAGRVHRSATVFEVASR